MFGSPPSPDQGTTERPPGLPLRRFRMIPTTGSPGHAATTPR